MVARARFLPILVAAVGAALTGCASLERPAGFILSPEQWRAGVARRGADPAEVPNPMSATPAMMTAAKELGGVGSDEERLERLRTALLDGRAFTFEYERSATFSAADAFVNRRGNCVSFTNLFIALGRSLGIRLQAALVTRHLVSEREGDLIITYNHLVAIHPLVLGQRFIVFDFYQTGEEPGGRFTLLDDFSVAAIRASNDGVAHLGRGEHAEAEHDLEIAVRLAPQLGPLHANLGLAKWRSGDVTGAFAAFRKGLEAEPRCPPLLQNLAALYVDQHRPAEARAVLAVLDVSQASPYVLIVRGNFEMSAGNVKGAIQNYRKAAGLDPKLADPWLAIARAEAVRGRPDAARNAARKALEREPGNPEALGLAKTQP
ncbi:MAG TPA: tetratricopeptide repeat protein [Thermoanaerobaculia bacterium]